MLPDRRSVSEGHCTVRLFCPRTGKSEVPMHRFCVFSSTARFAKCFATVIVFRQRTRISLPCRIVRFGMSACVARAAEGGSTALLFRQGTGVTRFPVHRICVLSGTVKSAKCLITLIVFCQRTRVSLPVCLGMGACASCAAEGSSALLLFYQRTGISYSLVHRFKVTGHI